MFDAPPVAEDLGRVDAATMHPWRDETSLPVRWQETAGATRGDRLFVVGGYEDGQPTARVRSFAPGESSVDRRALAPRAAAPHRRGRRGR
jgi:hypothetical protein